MGCRRRLCWLWLALALTGCESLPDAGTSGEPDGLVQDSGDELPSGSFAGPQGVAVARGLAFVANPNYRYSGQSLVYGKGFVTIVRLADGTVIDRVPTGARNPQAVVASGDRVVVLCSGATFFDGSVVLPQGDGSVLVLDAAEADAGRPSLVREIPLPRSLVHPMVGYPSSITLVLGASRAWLGSGTSPVLFLVDLDGGQVLRGADDPVVLGDTGVQDTIVVRSGAEQILMVGRFESDEVLLLDAVTGAPVQSHLQPFGVGSPGQMDGVLDIVERPGGSPDIFALLGLASSVAAIDSTRGLAGVHNGFAGTWLSPNRIVLDRDRLLVVNSGDNNITAIDATAGTSLGKVAILPVGTNPYDIALFVEGSRRLAVITGQKSQSLYVVDLDDGVVVREVR